MRTCLWLVLWFTLLLPGAVGADGMVYHATGGSMEVRATAQRAVLWLRGGQWEVHIQPVFVREAGEAAWVVPFQVCPEISASSADWFDQLELLTAAVFLETCRVPCCDEMCDGGVGDGRVTDGQDLVDVWDQGRVGELDYVVLSSADGDSLVQWLTDHGYGLPDGAGPVISVLASEGAYFFAARLSPEAEPARPLTPVRFSLPGLQSPGYPLRTTALGVGDSGVLELTLWVITPPDTNYLPHGWDYDWLEQRTWMDKYDYRTAMDRLFEDHPGRFLALTYSWPQNDNERIWGGMVCDNDSESSYSCARLSEIGITQPEEWCTEVDEMQQQGAMLMRYQGRLSTVAMGTDLAFEMDPESSVPRLDNVYSDYPSYGCWECEDPTDGGADGGADSDQDGDSGGDGNSGGGGGCGMADPGSAMAAVWMLIALALLLSMRRRD